MNNDGGREVYCWGGGGGLEVHARQVSLEMCQ